MAGSPQYVTLTANTVATLTFDKDFNVVEVTNVDGTAPIYFTADDAASTPVIDGTGTYVVTAGVGAFVQMEPPTNKNTVVKLISAGTPKVSVRAW